MQTSQWERARSRVMMYPCTCYMRLSPLVQSQINTHNPVTLSTPREDEEKYKDVEEEKGDRKRGQVTVSTSTPNPHLQTGK